MSNVHISYSQLSDFLACNYKHYLGYSKKLKSYDSDTIHLIFGLHMHSTIELFLKKELNKSEAINYFIKKMLSPESMSKQPTELLVKFKNQGVKILNEFFSSFAWDDVIIIANEFDLNEPIINNIFFKGKIDFIYRYKNYVYIADFKTSTKSWDKWKFGDIYYGLQLKLYKWFYCQKMKIPLDSVRLLYMVLNRNDDNDDSVKSLVTIHEVDSSYGEIKKAYNILINAIDVMYNESRNGEYLRKTIGYNCNVCEFNGSTYCEGNIDTPFYRNIQEIVESKKEKNDVLEEKIEEAIFEVLGDINKRN